MVQYEVTVKLVPGFHELFNIDSKMFTLEFPGHVDSSKIEKALFDKIPDACVESYTYKECITIMPGDIVWIKFYDEYSKFSLLKEITQVNTKKGTFTVPLTDYDIQQIYDNLDYKTYSSYRYKDHLVFNLSDCTEISRKKCHKATVELATESDIEYYNEGLQREEIASKINDILTNYFEDGYTYSKYIHTTDELKSFLSALQTFVKKYDD
jgi:hypothetical protein